MRSRSGSSSHTSQRTPISKPILHLEQIEDVEQAVRELEARADQDSFRAARELLTTMPGVSQVTARVILAEIGDDMSRFRTAG